MERAEETQEDQAAAEQAATGDTEAQATDAETEWWRQHISKRVHDVGYPPGTIPLTRPTPY
jgi:hypothetical protein